MGSKSKCTGKGFGHKKAQKAPKPSFSNIPLLAEEGWRDSLIKAGAPGAKREPDRAKPKLMVSSAECFAGPTTPSAPLIEASPCRARTSRAHPPLLCEEGNAAHSHPPDSPQLA